PSALQVVASKAGDPRARMPEIESYAAALSRIPGVARVDAITGSFVGGARVIGPNPSSARFSSPTGTWLSVVPSVEPLSPQGEHLVHEVRDLHGPFSVKVAGPSAQLVDSKASMFGRGPLALGIIA